MAVVCLWCCWLLGLGACVSPEVFASTTRLPGPLRALLKDVTHSCGSLQWPWEGKWDCREKKGSDKPGKWGLRSRSVVLSGFFSSAQFSFLHFRERSREAESPPQVRCLQWKMQFLKLDKLIPVGRFCAQSAQGEKKINFGSEQEDFKPTVEVCSRN